MQRPRCSAKFPNKRGSTSPTTRSVSILMRAAGCCATAWTAAKSASTAIVRGMKALSQKRTPWPCIESSRCPGYNVCKRFNSAHEECRLKYLKTGLLVLTALTRLADGQAAIETESAYKFVSHASGLGFGL